MYKLWLVSEENCSATKWRKIRIEEVVSGQTFMISFFFFVICVTSKYSLFVYSLDWVIRLFPSFFINFIFVLVIVLTLLTQWDWNFGTFCKYIIFDFDLVRCYNRDLLFVVVISRKLIFQKSSMWKISVFSNWIRINSGNISKILWTELCVKFERFAFSWKNKYK